MNQGDRLIADGPRGDTVGRKCLIRTRPTGGRISERTYDRNYKSYIERHHRTLTELKRTVQRHPTVDIARGSRQDDGRFRELDVPLSPVILGLDVDDAGLRIAWRPRPDPDEPAYFVFHYHDSSGLDFGWHREPNPHVDGLAHYQERSSPDDEYEYEPVDFESLVPVALCWDILGRIEERFRG